MSVTPSFGPRSGSRPDTASAPFVQFEMILLERRLAERPYRFRPPILGGDEPTLRDLLLRAGAAWLIGWAALLSVMRWGPLG